MPTIFIVLSQQNDKKMSSTKLTKDQKMAIRERVRRESDMNAANRALELQKTQVQAKAQLTKVQKRIIREKVRLEVETQRKPLPKTMASRSLMAQIAISIRKIFILFFYVTLGIFFWSQFDGVLDHVAAFGRLSVGLALLLYDFFKAIVLDFASHTANTNS
jgi:hypothetical protein